MTDTVLSPYHVTLGGVGLSLVDDPEGEGYQTAYEAQETTNQLVHRDVPYIYKDFAGGAGAVQLIEDTDRRRYGWAESLYMHFGSGPVLSGQVNNYDLTGTFTNDNGKGATPITNGRIVKMIEFNGDMYLIFDKSAIVRIANIDASQTPDYRPAINNAGYGTATTALGANISCRTAEVFKNSAAGQASLYIGARNTGTGAGRVYELVAGATTCTAGTADLTSGPTTYLADKLAMTYWKGQDGAGALRLLLATAAGQIRHCIDGSDPKLFASYVTPIDVGTPTDEIQALVSAPMHAYAVTSGGIVDFDEFRVRQLTPYWRATQSMSRLAASLNYGLPALLYDDSIIATRGFGSIDRYPVTQDGYQQRIIGECGPGAYMQDGTPFGNLWFTAMCDSGDGWVLAAGYNPDNGNTYILRGMDRRRAGVDGPGPFVWHGAETVIYKTAGVSYQATAMHVAAPAMIATGTFATPKTYLWIALIPSTGGQAVLKYVDLPIGGGPLAVRASGGTPINHTTSGMLWFTGYTGFDANSLKVGRRVDMVHQSVFDNPGAGTYAKIAVGLRADGDPSTLAAGTGFTTEGTANGSSPDGNVTNIVPATVTTGRTIYPRATFTVNAASTQSPRLQELRLRCNIRYEVFAVDYLNVVLERDHVLKNGSIDDRSPDSTLASIVAFQLTGPQTYVKETGSFQVIVEQGIQYSRQQIEGVGWRTVAKLTVSVVKAN